MDSKIKPLYESEEFLYMLFGKKYSLSVYFLRHLISELNIFQPKLIIGIVILATYRRIYDEEFLNNEHELVDTDEDNYSVFCKINSLRKWYKKPFTKTKRQNLLKKSPLMQFDHVDDLFFGNRIDLYFAAATLEESLYVLDSISGIDWKTSLIQDAVQSDEDKRLDINRKAQRLVGIVSCLIQNFSKTEYMDEIAENLFDDCVYSWLKDLMFGTKPLELKLIKKVLNCGEEKNQFTLTIIQLINNYTKDFNIRLLLKMEESSVRMNLKGEQAFDLLIKGCNIIDHLMNIYFEAFENVFENIYVSNVNSHSPLPEIYIIQKITGCSKFKLRQDLWDAFISPLLNIEIFPSWTNTSRYTPKFMLKIFSVIFEGMKNEKGPSQRIVNSIFQILSNKITSVVDLKIVGRLEAYEYYVDFYFKFFSLLLFHGFLCDDLELTQTFYRQSKKYELQMNFLHTFLEICDDHTFHSILKNYYRKSTIRPLFSITRWRILKSIKKPFRINLKIYLKTNFILNGKIFDMFCLRNELENIQKSIYK